MVTITIALALLAADPVSANPAGTIVGRVMEARKACAAGRVDEGVEILATIIAETGDLNALHNQARCYQLNGRTEQALSRFREYLRLGTEVPADERKRVEGFIKELEAELEMRARQQEIARALASRAAAPAPLVVNSTVGRSYRVASVALAGTAVAALVTGGYFNLRMGQISDDLESQWSWTPAQFRDRWNDGKQAELAARISYGVAAAAVAGSVTCFFLGRRAVDRERARLAVVPLLTAQGRGAGALVGVRF
jgi:hypothetical protein